MPEPLLYYVRHGADRVERRGTPPGPARFRSHRRRPRAGGPQRRYPARPDRAATGASSTTSTTSQARSAARATTMQRLRAALGLDPDALPPRRAARRGVVRAVGGLHLSRAAGEREQEGLAARERDKWNFAPPGGESYADLLARVSAWHDTRRARQRGGRAWRHRACPHGALEASRRRRRRRPRWSTRASSTCSRRDVSRATGEGGRITERLTPLPEDEADSTSRNKATACVSNFDQTPPASGRTLPIEGCHARFAALANSQA